MTDPGTDAVAPSTDEDDVQVPATLRLALVQAASDVLGALEPVEVPASLRAVYRFAPRRRASAGAGPLWAALGEDGFRARVARTWAAQHPGLAGSVAARDAPAVRGTTPDGAEHEVADAGGRPSEDAARPPQPTEPVPSWEAATGAWLTRSPRWRDLVPTVAPQAGPRPVPQDSQELARAHADIDALRAEVAVARQDAATSADRLAALQKDLRRLRSDADRARSEARRAGEEAAALLAVAQSEHRAAADERAAAAEDRRSADVERAAARAELRSARKLADVRVRLLLDTIVDAASGLRTELALPPVSELPADLVAPALELVTRRPGSRGRSTDDPALLEELLRQPRAHLLVDGYNVSKTGFGGLTLLEQRNRLVDGLGRLAARTGAEVTCCFDGQDGAQPPPVQSRSVRVLFSVGEIADDLIRRLVHAEPPGRVLVVVTSDQEVTRDVEALGSWVVPSATLVAWLQHL